MAKVLTKTHRTWIEIDSRAANRNYQTFRELLGRNTKLWAVVKSNAYGHGLVAFAKLVDRLGAGPVRSREGSQRISTSNGVDGFCVDSLVEGIRLRKEGIKKPILVLGPTLPALSSEANKRRIVVTVSSFDALQKLTQLKNPPEFHIKVDTGMHRQGFYPSELPRVIKLLTAKTSNLKPRLKGIYTHFASAKDINYPTYTERQFAEFQKAVKLLESAGLRNLIKHCSATGGAFLNSKYHLDAVRVGIGLYGLWPSKELEVQLGRKIKLNPVLSWRAVVSEVKNLEAGDFVGYDLVERVSRQMKMAIIPVGYWHGLPRSLSGIGEVLINGRRARILGRVSMDLIAVGPVSGCNPGDVATFIGKDGKEEISAFDVAQKAGTINYELLTRLNPLMERIIK